MDYEYNLQIDSENHLYVRIYKNKKINKKQKTNVLYVVHGLNEHSGRYEFVKEIGSDFFDFIVFYDHIGHGRSSGKRAYIKHFSGFSAHLRQVVGFCQGELTRRFGVGLHEQNTHLFGHSMGGMITLDFLDNNSQNIDRKMTVESAIISAPFIDPVIKTNKDKIDNFIGKFLYKNFKFLRSLSIKKNLADFISKDKSEIISFREDKLNSDMINFSLFFSQKDVRDKVLNSLNAHSLPTLFLSPQQDIIIDPKSVETAFNKMKNDKKKIIKYKNSYHESFRCVEKEKVLSDIKKFWVDSLT